MPRFDPIKMARLISELRNNVARLSYLSSIEEEAFLSDPDKLASAKYHFIVAIEACIDMGNHLISRNGYRLPEDYGDTFISLAEAGGIERGFANELRTMAKFRNRLVHLYWEVDNQKVREILQSRLGDFKIFLDEMARFLRLQEID